MKVAELSEELEELTNPQATSLGLSLACAWIAVHRLSEVKSSDNFLVIGKTAFSSLAAPSVHQRLPFDRSSRRDRLGCHPTSQREERNEHL